jgi:hypothetical protein
MLEQASLFSPQLVDTQDRVVESILDSATIIFCLVLFGITLYAWSRSGRQRSLLIVAVAFLTFLSTEAIDLLPIDDLERTLVRSILAFATLTLFFLALVLRPQRSRTLKDLR